MVGWAPGGGGGGGVGGRHSALLLLDLQTETRARASVLVRRELVETICVGAKKVGVYFGSFRGITILTRIWLHQMNQIKHTLFQI